MAETELKDDINQMLHERKLVENALRRNKNKFPVAGCLLGCVGFFIMLALISVPLVTLGLVIKLCLN